MAKTEAAQSGEANEGEASSPPSLVITPTYEEYDNLPRLTQRIWAVSPNIHILIVDDASGDGTPDWVRAHAEFNRRLFLLERTEKLGLGTAYLDGFRWGLAQDAGYAFFLQIDADLQHEPEDIPRLLEAANSGADLVLTSRYVGGVRVLNWPIRRLIMSVGAASYVQWMTGMPFTDPTGGFKLWRREVLECLDLDAIESNGYAFQIETTHTAWRMGFRIEEVPIIFEGRHAGNSKMSGDIAREAVFEVLKLAVRRRRLERRKRTGIQAGASAKSEAASTSTS